MLGFLAGRIDGNDTVKECAKVVSYSSDLLRPKLQDRETIFPKLCDSCLTTSPAALMPV